MVNCYSRSCWRHHLEYHYNKGKHYFKKCYSTSSCIFHITKESGIRNRVANENHLPYSSFLSNTFITISPLYTARGCWSWGTQLQFQCAKTQTKSWVRCTFLYDSENIAKHISVHIVLSTLLVLNKKFKQILCWHILRGDSMAPLLPLVGLGGGADLPPLGFFPP